MRKLLLPLLSMLCSFFTNAQIVFPGYFTAGQSPVYGAELADTITNTGSAPAVFYFNYISKDSFGNINESKKSLFLSDSSFAWYLYDKCKDIRNDDERLVAYVTELAVFYKNVRNFDNNLNITQPGSVTPSDSGFAKLEACTGLHASAHHMQCGDYARLAETTLYEIYKRGWDTIACKPNRYRLDDITGLHNIFEIWCFQKWALVDVDPGTTGFMFADNQNGGYYSLIDIMNNPKLVTENWGVRDDNMQSFFFPLSDSLQTEHYRAYFTGTFTLGPTWDTLLLHNPTGYSIPGHIILPPGGSIVFHRKVIGLDINVGEAQGRNWEQRGFDLSTAYGITGDPLYLDSLTQFLISISGLDSSTVSWIMQNNLFVVYKTYWKPCDVEFDGPITPTRLEYIIPASSDTLYIGKDIGGPFMVADCNLPHGGMLGDTIVTNTFSNMLWTASITGGQHNYSENLIQYFTNGGYIPPQGADVSIKCYYNPGYIDWWNGYSINELNSTDSLILKRSAMPLLVDNIPALGYHKISNWSIYPNPANESITISHPYRENIHNITIIGMTGQCYNGHLDTEGKVAIGGLLPGAYLLSIGENTTPKIFIKY